MNRQNTDRQTLLMRCMVWLGVVLAAATWVLRAVLMPTMRDNQTGRFGTSWGIVAVLLGVIGLMAVMAVYVRAPRLEIGGRWTVPVSLAFMAAGGGMLLANLWDMWLWLAMGQLPPPDTTVAGPLATLIVILIFAFGILGGVALIRLGLMLTAEGATRRGMMSWSVLAPVLWMWFRLVRYEMSYASAVGLSETFYDFALFILELLFLFKLARFVSGIGKVRTGSLLFFSIATAVFALSGPLTRLCMYLMGDSEAYLASQLAGLPDFLIGVMALVFAFALVGSVKRTAIEDGPPETQVSDVLSSEVSVDGSVADDADSQL